MIVELENIIKEIESVDDRALRSEVLVDLANGYQEVPSTVVSRPFDAAHKTPACQSDAYVWVVQDSQGKCFPYFAVENPQGLSAKALASLITQGCSGVSAEELVSVPDDIVVRVFGDSISMGKREGLMGMIRLMRKCTSTPKQI